MKKLLVLLLATGLISGCVTAQKTQTTSNKVVAKDEFQLAARKVTSIVTTISGSSTNLQLPTAKAVWDALQTSGFITLVLTTDELSGDGTDLAPLGIAQQGATSGQVLKWNGSTWSPAADASVTDGDKGDVDVTSSGANWQIDTSAVGTNELAADAVTSAKIADATIAAGDLGSMGAGSGQVMKWNGSAWTPSNLDASDTNEAQTLSATGAGPTAYNINLTTAGGSGGGDVTLTEGTGIDLNRSTNNITVTNNGVVTANNCLTVTSNNATFGGTATGATNIDWAAYAWTNTWNTLAGGTVGSSRVDLQACKLEYSIVSPK